MKINITYPYSCTLINNRYVIIPEYIVDIFEQHLIETKILTHSSEYKYALECMTNHLKKLVSYYIENEWDLPNLYHDSYYKNKQILQVNYNIKLTKEQEKIYNHLCNYNYFKYRNLLYIVNYVNLEIGIINVDSFINYDGCYYLNKNVDLLLHRIVLSKQTKIISENEAINLINEMREKNREHKVDYITYKIKGE